MKKVLICLFASVFTLIAPAARAQTASQAQDPDEITLDQFFSETQQSPQLTRNPNLSLSTDRAIAKLKGFPGVNYVVLKTREDAERMCTQGGFQGFFYWSSCVSDLTGKVFAQRSLELGKSIANSSVYGPLKDMMMALANQYLDEEAFETASTMITIKNLPTLAVVMAGATFEKELVSQCNSRASAVANLINPVMSARRLNQMNILNCIYAVRGIELNSLANKANFRLCKATHPDLPSRTQCFRDKLK